MSSNSDPAAAAAAAAWEEWLSLLGQNRSANYAYSISHRNSPCIYLPFDSVSFGVHLI
jgi:hypothetical protein